MKVELSLARMGEEIEFATSISKSPHSGAASGASGGSASSGNSGASGSLRKPEVIASHDIIS